MKINHSKTLFKIALLVLCLQIIAGEKGSPGMDEPELTEPGREAESSKETETKKKRKTSSPGLSADQIAKKKEVLEKILKYGSNKERKEAMREVVHFPKEHSESLYQEIAKILSEEADMGVKISCLRALSEAEYSKESKQIISAIADKSDDVREAAILAVQRLKLEDATPELLNFIKGQDFSKNQAITGGAITALSELNSGKQAAEFLEEKFREKNTHTNTRSSIALYFGKVKDIRAEGALIEVASDESEDPMTRAYAVHALGKMNSQKSIPKLKVVLDKINESKSKLEIKKLSNLKIHCIAALVILGDTEILKELVSYAKDDDPNVRLRAVKQLGEIENNPEVIELLEYKAQRDPSKKVQEVAKKALEDLKKKTTPETEPKKQ